MKTDLDCVIEAVEITLETVNAFTDVDDVLLTLSNNLRYMKQQQEMEARGSDWRSKSFAGWEKNSPLPEEFKLRSRGIDETDAEVRESLTEKVADTYYHYWDSICPLGHNIRCTTESQKNEWQESEAMVTKCKECAKYYSWTQCTFKPHQEEQQKCEHGNMVNLHDEKTGLFKDTFECQTCGHLQKSNNLPVTYHSGKDAIDKLMRGECDYIVFDDPVWIKDFVNLHLTDDNFLFSVKNTTGIALRPEYYLQTKWLCLKDEK